METIMALFISKHVSIEFLINFKIEDLKVISFVAAFPILLIIGYFIFALKISYNGFSERITLVKQGQNMDAIAVGFQWSNMP